MKYPILSIKKFGKIEKADIELSPLTLFVGDNNSGKSYLLSLIWGILDAYNNREYLFKLNDIIINDDIYKKCLDIIKNIEKEYELSNDDLRFFVELYNLFLKHNKDELIKYIFGNNISKIKIEEIKLKFIFENESKISISKEEIPIKNQMQFSVKGKGLTGFVRYEIGENIDNKINSFVGIFVILILNLFDLYDIDNIFLPTSRTGFILSYKKLAANTIEDDFEITNNNKDQNSSSFTRPIVKFINRLLLLEKNDNDNDYNKKLISFIENNVIYGKLYLDSETKNVYYRPFDNDIEFSMNISSAVITEISPLYLFLKYNVIDVNIFIEEPEISLHPELQQKIAQLLIQMVNYKKNIFITTHSDTIVQHINNMISLYHNSEENKKNFFKKYHYSNKDIINEDKIRMYQFDVNKQTLKTEIKELKSSQYGFELPTFNGVLKNIHNEIIDFHADI